MNTISGTALSTGQSFGLAGATHGPGASPYVTYMLPSEARTARIGCGAVLCGIWPGNDVVADQSDG